MSFHSLRGLQSRAGRASAAFFAMIAFGLALHMRDAEAQSRNVPVVRDAEIEALVRDYAQPIFRAAGLSRSGIDIILVNDPSFNAFVAGRRLFINTGALMIAETPNEIIGVIAHEAGHLAGGHQERLRAQIARAQTMAIVSALLGIGATVAGAATDNGALAGVGGGIAAGGAEMARRGLLGYQRTEETTADRSALTYLEKTKQSPKGMITTFERFASALALSGSRLDPYKLSHPLPRDRIANLSELARKSPYFEQKDPASLQQRHDLARAKIAAYTQSPGTVSRMFGRDRTGLAARYGDAITTFLYGNPGEALRKVDALIRVSPDYAYFHELRGEVLIKANRTDAAAEAFATATRLDPNDTGILKAGYGHALVASGKPENLKKAIGILKSAIAADRENPATYHLLAQAEGRLGDVAAAELATAEGHFFSGRFQDAKIFATRAQIKMKRGTPGWVRAQDIIEFTVPDTR
jgi:predicted Zn-dependent protease